MCSSSNYCTVFCTLARLSFFDSEYPISTDNKRAHLRVLITWSRGRDQPAPQRLSVSQTRTFQQSVETHSSVSQILTRNNPDVIRTDDNKTTGNKTDKPSPAGISRWILTEGNCRILEGYCYYSACISSSNCQGTRGHINHLKLLIFQRFRFTVTFPKVFGLLLFSATRGRHTRANLAI